MAKRFLSKNIKIKTVSEAEAKSKGLQYTEKVQKESGKFNSDYLKDVTTKLKDLYKYDEGEDDAIKEVKKYTRSEDQEAYETEAYGAGKMQGIKYDNEGTEAYDEFEKRIDELNDTSEYDEQFGTHDGFGEGERENTYEKLKKAGKDYQDYKYGDARDEAEDDYQRPRPTRSLTGKKEITKESTMKRLNFKQPFKDENHMVSLIKESYKIDEHVFLMADGNQTYKVRWEGDAENGEAVTLLYKNEEKINESKEMMKKLYDYKQSSVVGKTNDYINETVEFKKMFDIIRENKEK